MTQVPDEYGDLLSDGQRGFMMLTTLLSDGSPIVTPIWFTVQGDDYLITTHPDSLKARNMTQLLSRSRADATRSMSKRRSSGTRMDI